MLVIPLGDELHRAHERGVRGADRLLEVHREGEVIPPAAVGKPALIRADEHHHLTCAHAVLLRHGLVHRAVLTERIAVDVDDHTDAGVVRQPVGYRLCRARVGAGIAGVIVYPPVVDDVQPRVFQHRRQLVADADDVVLRVLGARLVARLVFIQPRGGIRLAGMRVDDEYLRALRREAERGSREQQLPDVGLVPRLILDGKPALYRGLQYLLAPVRRFRDGDGLHGLAAVRAVGDVRRDGRGCRRGFGLPRPGVNIRRCGLRRGQSVRSGHGHILHAPLLYGLPRAAFGIGVQRRGGEDIHAQRHHKRGGNASYRAHRLFLLLLVFSLVLSAYAPRRAIMPIAKCRRT